MKAIRAPRKVYAVDNGFIAARARWVSDDHGRLLENAVFLELVRRGCKANRDLFHYRTGNNLEVDILLMDGTRPHTLIQVCHTLDDAQTKAREIKGLAQAKEERRCPHLAIVTWGTEATLDQDGLRVSAVPFSGSSVPAPTGLGRLMARRADRAQSTGRTMADDRADTCRVYDSSAGPASHPAVKAQGSQRK